MQKVSKHHMSKLCQLQHGFSLVEILVAMAIGLLLTAGLIQILSGSKQTYRVQDNLSRLQENGRFAIVQLGNSIRMAGFKTDPTDTTTFAAGAVTGTDTTGNPDQISVSFQGASDGTTIDCIGNTVPASTVIVNQFSINNNNLRCVSTSGTQDLIENVEDMQITYGVDTNGSGSANYYVAANSVANWSQVVSIHFSLLLRTQEDNLTTAAQTYQYNGTATTATDRRLREAFSTTIALRNLLP
ncbi:MAG: PilW family protein [Thiogranum sp.]